MTYGEQLRAPWTWWLVGFGLVGCIAIVVLAYLPPWAGISACVLAAVAVAAGLIAYGGTRLTVSQEGVRVGRYFLAAEYVAGASAFIGKEAGEAVGPGADPRSFLFTRPFVRDLVRIDLDDAADPHPCWLVSTRRPVAFAAAIEELKK